MNYSQHKTIMEDKEIKLPLPVAVSRCYGYTGGLGEFCRKSNECARHQTIMHKDEPWGEIKTPHRMLCSDENTSLFMEYTK